MGHLRGCIFLLMGGTFTGNDGAIIIMLISYLA